ncbi:MAG TPA: dethiobiotin synthase [Stellaceae bacterium]|nr:dethiobiotin synthase [Stellaceae bacterium]
MSAFFVTGTGTDVGKTFIATGLIHALRRAGREVEALKPLASGYIAADPSGDPERLLAALGQDATADAVAAISPWRFRAPLSPDMAAAREGASLDVDRVIAFCGDRVARRRDVLLIEGVGGVMVPLHGRLTVLDWMAALSLPVVLVAGSYLGTLSHTLTAITALTARGLELAALVVNESPGSTVDVEETAATLARFVAEERIVTLPRLPRPETVHPAFDRMARAF